MVRSSGCSPGPSLMPYHGRWWPQRDSNPCFSLERAVSWASRRWGRDNHAAATAVRGVAGGGGFEPPLRGPEPRVLPLDDPPKSHADAQVQHTVYGKSTNGAL